MNPEEAAFFRRFQQRAGSLTPAMIAALLTAFATIREGIADPDQSNETIFLDRWLATVLSQALLDTAMAPVRDQVRRGVRQSFQYFVMKEIPKPPPALRSLTVSFDVLNPNVITAIRQLETRVITSLEESIRETVRAFVENGLRDGLSTSAIARDIRSLIGLAPNQLQEVQNFRDALLGLNGRNVTDYTLRNHAVDRLMENGPLTPAQVERYTELYRKSRITQNAASIAQSASRDALKLGQRLSWQGAIDKGLVDGSRLRHQWIGVDDDRERDAHRRMNNQSQPYDQPYSNGQMIPGETDWNCRCGERFYLAA